MQPQEIRTIGVDEVSADAVVLDVREDDEWVAGHIDGARHVPMMQVPQHPNSADDLTPQTPLVVVCKVGGRSAQVTAWLTQQGYDATNLAGGMLAWAAAGRPMICEDGGPPRVA